MFPLKEDNGSAMTDDHRCKLLGCFDCQGQFHHSRIKARLRARGESEPNFKEAKAEQRLSRISMEAIAAEFQWELSFLEQKQQACLFLFFVGEIAKKHMMSARRVPRACLLCRAFRSSYIELFYVSVH